MKGLVVNNNKQLVLREHLTDPIPEQGEVSVEIKSASVNAFDAESAQGRFDSYFAEYGVDKDVQSGLEFSGIVKSDGVKFKQGDEVFGYVHMITGDKSHAEFIAIDESYMALKPKNLTFSQAAAIPLGALTSLVALQDIAQLKAGMKVLINGAVGGVGIYAIQIAKLLNAHVTAMAGKSQAEFLKSYGADHVYDYNNVSIDDLNDTFDLILDLTKIQTLASMKKHLTATGLFIPAEPNSENGGESEDQQLGYLMVFHGDFEKLTRIADWVSTRKLKAVVDKDFPFLEYPQALARLKEKGRRGRITLSW